MNRCLVFMALLICAWSIDAQSVKTLKQRRVKNQKEIEYTNKILSKVRNKHSSSLARLNVLKENIKHRAHSLTLFKEEIARYDRKLINAGRKIKNLKIKQQQLKKIYATLISNAYLQSGTLNKWIYIFSAKDFTQAYNRYKYYDQFTAYTKNQLAELNKLQDSAKVVADNVKKIKRSKERLANYKKKEKRKLSKQQKNYQKEIARLKTKEKDLLSRLKVQQRRDKILARRIRQLIRKNAKKVSSNKVTKIDIALSNSFVSNKGKLPWPSRGFVSSRFGKHKHPILKTVEVRNDGIDITTKKGSGCRAIFKGEVSQVLSIAGLNHTVIIKHGNYLSVYANLLTINVKKGDKVTTGQTLGKIATSSDGATIIKLQIWKGTKCQNPLYWLNKR